MLYNMPDDILVLGRNVIVAIAEDCGVVFIHDKFGKHKIKGSEGQIEAFKTRCRGIIASSCQHISFFTARSAL